MTKDDVTEASADEKRRRAITAWWERQGILDFIRRIRLAKIDGSEG